MSVKPIQWRDEKLYKVCPNDYGGLSQRFLGVTIHAITRGIGIAVVLVFIFASPGMFNSIRDWYLLFPPLVGVCAIGCAIADRSSYNCEIEIRSDRVVRYSGGGTYGIERAKVHSMREGTYWTLFGRAHGLSVRSKHKSIFIPSGCPDYAEIKARLNDWQPVNY